MTISRERIELTLCSDHARMVARVKLADDRMERLGQSARDYEKETTATQTPEECARLDRMIDLTNRASVVHDRLQARATLLLDSIRNIEEEANLARRVYVRSLAKQHRDGSYLRAAK